MFSSSRIVAISSSDPDGRGGNSYDPVGGSCHLPGITDFLLQQAEDPQPCAVSSALVLEIILISPPAGFQGIEFGPLPR